MKGIPSEKSELRLIIYNEHKIYTLPVKSYIREDITQWLNDGNNYDASGFVAGLDKSKLAKGNYELGIMVREKESSVESYKPFSQTITVK